METSPRRHSMMMAQVPQAIRMVRPLGVEVIARALLLPNEGAYFATTSTGHGVSTHRESGTQCSCVVFFLQTLQ